MNTIGRIGTDTLYLTQRRDTLRSNFILYQPQIFQQEGFEV